MRAAGLALLWIVATIGGVILLAKSAGAGAAMIYLIAAVTGALWRYTRL